MLSWLQNFFIQSHCRYLIHHGFSMHSITPLRPTWMCSIWVLVVQITWIFPLWRRYFLDLAVFSWFFLFNIIYLQVVEGQASLFHEFSLSFKLLHSSARTLPRSSSCILTTHLNIGGECYLQKGWKFCCKKSRIDLKFVTIRWS